MCGIVGYVGKRDAVDVLLQGLSALEYRGYDSSGIAVQGGEELCVVKRAGRLDNLRRALGDRPLHGHAGIGHTRWATHGAATDTNAHPFVSCCGKFAVVHNGIIANYLSIAAFLRECGVSLVSDTDSEVVAHLIEHYYRGDVLAAIKKTVGMLKGSFALGILSAYEPERLYGVRKDSPLIIGKSKDGFALCSDISGISDFCDCICPMENGEIVSLSSQEGKLCDFEGKRKEIAFVPREREELAERQAETDDMLCEIRQIPMSLLLGYEGFPKERMHRVLKREYDKICVIGCGSAYHAGLVFCGAMRELCGTEVSVEVASEFVTQRSTVTKDTLVIAVSQSGETADTLLAVGKAKAAGATILCVCNVKASSLVRISDECLITRCGREKAVAATKSYCAQVHALLMICLEYAEIQGKIHKEKLEALRQELAALHERAEEIVRQEHFLSQVALAVKDASAVFFLGRGQDYAAAREGSLKLKEVSYLFSEAYPAGELKHGTLALMEQGVYGVIVATDPSLLSKNAATISEITCRGASAIVICSGETAAELRGDYLFSLPEVTPAFSPVLSSIAMQMIAYFAAKARGCDVDKPRNLAKSVTVE